MPSKQTENYHLSQWEKTDKVLMEDFNADNLAIEEALSALAAADAAKTATLKSLETSLSKKGNITIGSFSYNGTDKYGTGNETRVPFPRMPAAFLIAGYEGFVVGLGRATELFGTILSGNFAVPQPIKSSWSGNTLLMTNSNSVNQQMNRNSPHLVIAFYSEG